MTLLIRPAVAGTQKPTAVSAVGVSFPLHSSANGKAILAAMTDESIARLRRRIRLTAITPNTITSWHGLAQEIEVIRKKGCA